MFYENCLSACEVFCDKMPEEKAKLVKLVGACALCLDWTRDHKTKDCQDKAADTAESSHIIITT